MNEGSGGTVGDSSGNGNVGTINGATWTTDATRGSVLSFGGDGDHVFADPADLLLNAYTIAIWVKSAAPNQLTFSSYFNNRDGGGPTPYNWMSMDRVLIVGWAEAIL